MNCYLDYQLMYLILDGINYSDENEDIVTFLVDADPYIWEGEGSADPAIYKDFKEKYYSWNDHEDFSYNFVLNYLKTIDYYKGLFDAINSITKERYIECCNDILNNHKNLLKL